MKIIARTSVVLLILISTGFGKELSLGADLPKGDVKMLDIGGQMLSLNDIKKENGLVVIFSCNTCPWVIAWQDRYVELAAKYQEQGFGFVAINPNATYREKGDGYADMQNHAKEYGYNFYYTLDKNSELARVFGATRTPHIYVFDKTDKLVYRGAIDDNARKRAKVEESYLDNALAAILTGSEISIASTKALGCTIKYNK